MKDGSAMVEGECMSPSNDTLDRYRIEVVGATFDEQDNQDRTSEDFSAASTVDVDNTHPYLLRYADAYAHENNNNATPNGIGPTFVGVKPSTQFKEGQHVVYTGNNGTKCEAVVMKMLHDNNNQQPHYTIKLASGTEEQAESDMIDPKMHMGAKDENGEAPKNSVDFKSNSTQLFLSLYQSKWETAERRLASHPEEASIWVTRYAKSSDGSNGEIRWQLLPVHLYICLVGLRKEEVKTEATDAEMKENSTMKLLTDLLLAYPQATQCTDDQNMIPLHSAIRGNSSLAIIHKLLEVDPASVYWKDGRGRNAFQIVEKIYEKPIHKQQEGNEDEARLMRYAELMELLTDAARRVSSLTSNGEVVERVHKTNPDESQKQLMQLQNENLALRRENAELQHRAEINTRLLLKLVEKLQIYEEERSVNIENYNEIFGSKDELDEKRKDILVSLSADDDTEEYVEAKEHVNGVQVDSGDGAYRKRLERYHHTMNPSPTVPGTTEVTTLSTSPLRLNTGDEHVANVAVG
ncbi:hypothetical protein ACHAXH_003671, partial [Discostella pseudostelligera]